MRASRVTDLSGDERLRVISPAPRDVWRDLLSRDPAALFFHSPDWVDRACADGGYEDVSRLYETRQGRLLVLPLLRRNYLGGVLSRQGSLPPGWGTGGVLSDGPLSPSDVSAVFADLQSDRRVLRTLVQTGPRAGSVWDVGAPPGVKPIFRRGHVLQLGSGFDRVWSKNFAGTARTAVRKAEKAGVEVAHDMTGALIPEFLALRRISVERWARQQHEPLALARWRSGRRDPAGRLQAMSDAVPGGFHLYLARHEGRAVAGIVVLRARAASYIQGAMDKELAGPVRANYLLHRLAIEDACLSGCTFYDFGETGNSSQLAQFKTRFGAEPTHYSDYLIEPLPFSYAGRAVRTVVKRVVGFRGPPPVTLGAGPSGGGAQ